MNIKEFCEYNNIKRYSIIDDVISVDGDVELYLKDTKLPFRFSKVTGSFYCQFAGLTTLCGFPEYVGGTLWIGYNKLKNLEHSPKIVNGNFNVHGNNLTTLKGSPLEINGNLSCINNNLVDFDGISDYIGGNIYCSSNNIYTTNGLHKCCFVGKLFCIDNLLSNVLSSINLMDWNIEHFEYISSIIYNKKGIYYIDINELNEWLIDNKLNTINNIKGYKNF